MSTRDMILSALLSFVLLTAAGLALFKPQPFSIYIQVSQEDGSAPTTLSAVEVDLGYSVYQGYHNSTSRINVFKGIRFAQAPIGELRWQAPRPPLVNRSEIIPATEYQAQCPQSGQSLGAFKAWNNNASSEDCLFLNVYAPANVTKTLLPVFLYIHGGGHGCGNGQWDLQPIINTNGNNFVAIVIQYRVGAFGFLSSDEVHRKGVTNAGLLDQTFALQWVQQYAHLFNGDPRRVTLGGESSGAGSVMLQSMAYGGSLGSQLFENIIAASPYLPTQYGYRDWAPTQAYYAFAAEAGCGAISSAGKMTSTFECLLNVSSAVLTNASDFISQSAPYGSWAFLPVTDGVLIQDTPSRQLTRGAVNGVTALVGNNANEGYIFVPQNIHTEQDFLGWLRSAFPLFSDSDIAKLLFYYPSTNVSMNPEAAKFDTSGVSGPTAINQSSLATGQQQRANNIYAETAFVCPSYWLAEAYSKNPRGGQSYKYQFSVPPGIHFDEVTAWQFWPGTAPYSVDFAVAMQRIYGNFITTSNPSISTQIATGASGVSNVSANAAKNWSTFSMDEPYQVNLNTTCGSSNVNFAINNCADGMVEQNHFTVVDAYTWEGGRGIRCDWWRSVAGLVPE